MAKYSQADRPISIHTPLGKDALLLESIRGQEGISQLYRFQLELWTEAPIPFDQALGLQATVTVRFPNGSGRSIHGILTQLCKGGREPAFGLLRYTAELSPAAWLLTQRVQSRAFQQQTVPEIISAILRDEWQLSVVQRLTAAYPRRDYCVQYRESDWSFVCRLMEDEGISYYFQHDDRGHRLVLADHATSFAELASNATVAYQEETGGVRELPAIRAWEQSQSLGAYQYTLRDYHFEKPLDTLTAQRSAAGTVAAGSIVHPLIKQHTVNDVPMLEVYDYPGAFAHDHECIGTDRAEQPRELESLHDDLERRTRIRLEEQSTSQLSIRGTGSCGHFAAGCQFRLARHFDGASPPGEADRYVLTRVDLTASIAGSYTTTGDAAAVFESRFECLPVQWPLRPRRQTPRPRIEGPQTATVVGPQGEESFVDRFGRVKVRFHWDRAEQGNSSCWVRVAQCWAGKGWGAFFWPRLGHEVVVAFEDGDPDRPLIVGSVYNAVNMPPLELPDYVTIAGFKSCIFGGSPDVNFNSVFIYDTPGKEYVHVHSEKSERQHSEQHKLHYVPGVNFTINGDY